MEKSLIIQVGLWDSQIVQGCGMDIGGVEAKNVCEFEAGRDVTMLQAPENHRFSHDNGTHTCGSNGK